MPTLQIAITGRLHIVVDGRALCEAPVEQQDMHKDGAGLVVWNTLEDVQCGVCLQALTPARGGDR